jgi:hypothetical protein
VAAQNIPPSGRICWSPTRRAQCARLLGTRRLAGPGAVLRPGSAGCNQAGTVCLFAGSTSTRRPDTGLCFPSSVSAAGAVVARDWVRPTLSWNVVAQGRSQSPGPAGASGAERASGPLAVCGPGPRRGLNIYLLRLPPRATSVPRNVLRRRPPLAKFIVPDSVFYSRSSTSHLWGGPYH